MKKFVGSLAIVSALAFSAVAFAGGGADGGGKLAAHLAKVQGQVTRYDQRCQVSTPAANCTAKKAKLTFKLNAFETKLDQKIAKGPNAAKIARLTSARDQVASLLASL